MATVEVDREAVLAAFSSVEALNREAEVSNAALQAILEKLATDSGEAGFEQFCLQLLSSIKTYFRHFRTVRPQLAKMRALQDFLRERSESLPRVWNTFTTALGEFQSEMLVLYCLEFVHFAALATFTINIIAPCFVVMALSLVPVGLPELEPLDQQSINRELFEACMRDLLAFPATPTPPVRMLADEENAVQYASGYILMKLMKKLEKRKGMKAVRFRECLADLSVSGNDSSFYLYTLEWFNAINRGKLYHVHDNAFLFFRAVEVKTQQLLPGHLQQPSSKKEDLLQKITSDRLVLSSWDVIATGIEDAAELLAMVVDLWVTIRGFSLTSKWLEEYKLAKHKTLQKSKPLRDELAED